MNLDLAVESLETLGAELPEFPGEVRLEDHTIVIDNPAAKGAMTVQMMAGLGRCVRALRGSSWPVVRLLSVGDHTFCSGGHLGQVRAGLGGRAAGATMCQAMTTILDGLQSLPPVVMGVIDGPALGGGAELLTACDLVIAGPRARVGFVHAGLGVSTGWGGGRRLIQQIGRRAALRMLVSRQVLDTKQGQAIGLFDRTCTDVREGSLSWSRSIEGGVPAAVQAMKAIVRGADEAEAFVQLWGSSAHLSRLNPPRSD